MQITESFRIDRPVTEVFAVLTDPGRLPEWQRSCVEVDRAATGPLTVGERFGEVHAAMGRRNASTVEVVEYDAPHTFALRIIDGPLPFDGRWTLGDEAGGTRVDFKGTLEGGGLRRLLKPAIARQFRTHHRHLREVVEGRAGSAGASVERATGAAAAVGR
jgi:uncharacterized protein YndB with AHSA1/START domain